MERLTKIVCTLGPATSGQQSIKSLAQAGMDFARLNFSHGSYIEHGNRIKIIKRLSKAHKKIKIIQDLPGPKIRLGKISGTVLLKNGSTVRLTSDQSKYGKCIPVSYDMLAESVSHGSTILLCDGSVKLKVTEVSGDVVTCSVESGGAISSNKGVSITGTTSKVSAITKKDIEHIQFGAKNSVDFVAISFVNRAKDIELAKSIIAQTGSDIPVIAKIETKDALADLDKIIKASDAVMVARGDLALEIGMENLPLAQKLIIKRSNFLKKPVITATQMLYSMISSSTPTRAEATDVANAIIDGTDALMLSDETTVGSYANEAVQFLSSMSMRMEIEPEIRKRLLKRNGIDYRKFLT